MLQAAEKLNRFALEGTWFHAEVVCRQLQGLYWRGSEVYESQHKGVSFEGPVLITNKQNRSTFFVFLKTEPMDASFEQTPEDAIVNYGQKGFTYCEPRIIIAEKDYPRVVDLALQYIVTDQVRTRSSLEPINPRRITARDLETYAIPYQLEKQSEVSAAAI